mgnify:CR=1 FL=1
MSHGIANVESVIIRYFALRYITVIYVALYFIIWGLVTGCEWLVYKYTHALAV